MEERYLRNLPALTEAESAELRKKRVLIVGCGGIGGHLVDMMLRIGVGYIRVCDGDVFTLSNLNRQLLSDLTNIGKNKARAAACHGGRINPDVTMEVFDTFMNGETVSALIAHCDAVLDAMDNIEGRKLLSDACAQHGIPYIFGAIGGWIAQAAISMPGDALIDILYPENGTATDRSSLSFTPALCASMQTALCIRLLTGQAVKTGVLYHFDLRYMEFDAISASGQ